MDDSTYNALVSSAFKRMLKSLDSVDPDLLDVVATSDMLTVTHVPTGQKVIVNTQRAVWQIWVAGQGQGIHFDHRPTAGWQDDKAKGLELFAWVSSCVNALDPALAVAI